jgi:23S rRNA pseudouridine2457 synthase
MKPANSTQITQPPLEWCLMAEKLVYVAFYKPYGVLTAFTDPEGHETLKAYIDVPDIYPVGRLDLDSEGLLLLTNDGPLAHRLTDPAHKHPKTYLVQVEGEPPPEALSRLENGVEVKGKQTRRCQVMISPEPELPPRRKPVTPHGPTTWLRIVLREGMKRQIRHMTAAVGLPTLRLVRISIGPVSVDKLQPGEWRYLTLAEIKALKDETEVPRPGFAKAGEKPVKSPGNAPGSRYRNAGRPRPAR